MDVNIEDKIKTTEGTKRVPRLLARRTTV